jgi:hypothetical protein
VAPPNRGRPNTASVEPWNTTFRGKGHEAPLLPVTKSIIVIYGFLGNSFAMDLIGSSAPDLNEADIALLVSGLLVSGGSRNPEIVTVACGINQRERPYSRRRTSMLSSSWAA